MRRILVPAFVVGLLAIFAASAFAFHVEHKWEQVGLDGTLLHHKNGLRLGHLETVFDANGLSYLAFKVTPLIGTVRLTECQVMVNGQAVYKLSEKEPLNIDLHLFETARKHYNKAIRFDPFVKGFNHDTGSVQWHFLAGGKTYIITWTIKDNEVKTTVVDETKKIEEPKKVEEPKKTEEPAKAEEPKK
jgi:hypothetical protein